MSSALDSEPELGTLLKRLKSTVVAQRYLILRLPLEGLQKQTWEVVSAFGFRNPKRFLDEAISVSILQNVAETLQPSWSGEHSLEEASNSFLLAGISAFVCVPWLRSGDLVLLYADDQRNWAEMGFTEVLKVQNLLRPVRPESLPLPRKVSTAVPKGQPGPRLRLSLGEQARLLRVIATFLSAGIPILSSLSSLAEYEASGKLRQVAHSAQQELMQGRPLSEAFQRNYQISELTLHMLVAGESSGQLNLVCQQLADQLEQQEARLARLRSSLIYPASVMAVALLIAFLLPSVVLRDSLSLYPADTLPWPTQFIRTLGGWGSWPPTWAAGLLAGSLFLYLCKRQQALLGIWGHRWAARLAGLRRVRQTWFEVQFATAMALQLRAGLPLVGASQCALRCCANPLWKGEVMNFQADLLAGESLSSGLRHIPELSGVFQRWVSVAEEMGHLPQTFAWISKMAQEEFEQSLEQLLVLLEPFLLLAVGGWVAFVCLATLLPSLQLLERL